MPIIHVPSVSLVIPATTPTYHRKELGEKNLWTFGTCRSSTTTTHLAVYHGRRHAEQEEPLLPSQFPCLLAFSPPSPCLVQEPGGGSFWKEETTFEGRRKDSPFWQMVHEILRSHAIACLWWRSDLYHPSDHVNTFPIPSLLPTCGGALPSQEELPPHPTALVVWTLFFPQDI